MSEVFLCKTGQLNAVGKHDLRKAGVVVVEVEDPASCQFIRSAETISGDDMLWAAMDALKRNFGYGDEGRKQREQFAFNLHDIVKAHRPDKAAET
jgi:hypothetical protein